MHDHSIILQLHSGMSDRTGRMHACMYVITAGDRFMHCLIGCGLISWLLAAGVVVVPMGTLTRIYTRGLNSTRIPRVPPLHPVPDNYIFL
jgi:hypothetical protein